MASTELEHVSKKLRVAQDQCVLMWFRMDLRVQDNISLYRASLAASNSKLPLVALFVVSPKEWKKHHVSELRVDFWLRNLTELKKSLDTHEIPLIIKHSATPSDVPQTVMQTALDLNAVKVYWNKEYEVNEQKRDANTLQLLKTEAIDVVQLDDQCIVKPSVVRTKENKVYSVFTPFKKSWIVHVLHNLDTVKPTAAVKSNQSLPDSIKAYALKNTKVPVQVDGFDFENKRIDNVRIAFPAGEQVANEKLDDFIEKRAKNYQPDRDFPAVNGTSGLSAYLAAGVLSPRVCLMKVFEKNNRRMDSGDAGLVTWISELCWRDFYKNILVSFPRVCMGKPYKLDTDKIEWKHDDAAFEKWKQGKTGFPIVDAGMRQLNATGWMHNRLRMVTAMFLTKDLLIDWHKGEEYFMENLIDGDFASNNGGWQWAASTGTDSVPYFRIFNPTTQSERFDKEGKFIKKWIPELAKVSTAAIHDPYSKLSPQEFARLGYQKPIVDHKTARETTIAAFKAATGKKE